MFFRCFKRCKNKIKRNRCCFQGGDEEGFGFSGLRFTKIGCLSHFTIYQTDTYPILVSIYLCISIYIKYVTKITSLKQFNFSFFSQLSHSSWNNQFHVLLRMWSIFFLYFSDLFSEAYNFPLFNDKKLNFFFIHLGRSKWLVLLVPFLLVQN